MGSRDLIKSTAILLAITIVSGGALAAIYSLVEPILESGGEFLATINSEKFFPGYTNFTVLGHGEGEYLRIYDKDKKMGYIVNKTGKGFGGDIDMILAINDDFALKAVKILHHAETPGLGAKVLGSEEFMGWLEGKEESKLLFTNAKEEVRVVSGASVTTRAVLVAINDAIDLVREGESNGL